MWIIVTHVMLSSNHGCRLPLYFLLLLTALVCTGLILCHNIQVFLILWTERSLFLIAVK